jgi:precorrin-6B methylase 2
MKSLHERLTRVIRRDGLRFTALRILGLMLGEKDAISKAKEKVFKKLIAEYDRKIAYGPFRGMRLGSDIWWGTYDSNSKILGVYEEEVTQKLHDILSATKAPFVDLGAADGYYAIGVAFSGMADVVYAYEISKKGRASLQANAAANGCAQKVVIAGEADYDSLKALIDKFGKAVILIDIEGGEYDLLSDRMLDLLKTCHMIVELHPAMVEDGERKEAALVQRAQKHFTPSKLYRESYAPNRFPELNAFGDDERLLAVSEGRARNPKWLVLEPKA